MGGVMTVSQAAESLQITGEGVRDLIRRGRLVGFRVGPLWMVYTADVERYRGEREERRAKISRVAAG